MEEDRFRVLLGLDSADFGVLHLWLASEVWVICLVQYLFGNVVRAEAINDDVLVI